MSGAYEVQRLGGRAGEIDDDCAAAQPLYRATIDNKRLDAAAAPDRGRRA